MKKFDKKNNEIILISDLLNGTGGIFEVYNLLYGILKKNGVKVQVWSRFDKKIDNSLIDISDQYKIDQKTILEKIGDLNDPIFIFSSHNDFNNCYKWFKDEKIICHFHSSIATLLKPFSNESWRFNSYNYVNSTIEKDMIVFLSKTDSQLFNTISELKSSFAYNPIRKTEYSQPKKLTSDVSLVWCGRIYSEAKNAMFLIELAKQLKSLNLNWKIKVFSQESGEFSKLIELNQLENNIILMGYSTSKDEIYNSGEFLLLCSKYEGSPMVINETICYGLYPISTFSSFAVKEILGDDLVDTPNDVVYKIKHLLDNPKEYYDTINFLQMKTKKERSDETIYSQWIDIFDKTINNFENREVFFSKQTKRDELTIANESKAKLQLDNDKLKEKIASIENRKIIKIVNKISNFKRKLKK